jgi:uncharacterized membrane protein YfcA
MAIRWLLLVLLAACSVLLVVRWWTGVRDQRASTAVPEPADRLRPPTLVHIAIGFVTNFFDTLGIGSFATTTALYRLFGLVEDERIPGTMIAGHALPMLVQAFLFIGVVPVDPVTLILTIVACVVGGWFGAGVVTRLPRRKIQIGMAMALCVAAVLMAMSNLGLFPGAGNAIGLEGLKLLVAVVMSVVFGALLTIGIGNHGPSLVFFSLLGMEPRSAFPIMMGSGGFVAMLAGMRFIGRKRYHLQAALGLTIGGIPGVLIAGLVVRSLPLTTLRWLVVLVVVYAALSMVRSATLDGRAKTALDATA